MQSNETLLVATLLSVPVGLAWEFGVVPRWQRRQERIELCRHVYVREGDHTNRTARCQKCPAQYAIRMRRCPKCRQWSDEDEV